MSYKDFFPGRFLKADDLQGRKWTVTITKVPSETVGQGAEARKRPIAHFDNAALKPLILNQTNCATIADITGTDDEQDWAGHKVTLVPTRTTFKNERVACIRIEEPGFTSATPPATSDLLDSEFDEPGVPR